MDSQKNTENTSSEMTADEQRLRQGLLDCLATKVAHGVAIAVGSYPLFGHGNDRDFVLPLSSIPEALRPALRKSQEPYPDGAWWAVRDGLANYIICETNRHAEAWLTAQEAAKAALGDSLDPHNPIAKALCEKAGRKHFFRAVMTALGYPDPPQPTNQTS